MITIMIKSQIIAHAATTAEQYILYQKLLLLIVLLVSQTVGLCRSKRALSIMRASDFHTWWVSFDVLPFLDDGRKKPSYVGPVQAIIRISERSNSILQSSYYD